MDDSAERDEFVERMMSDPAMIQRYPRRSDRKAAAEKIWDRRQRRPTRD